MASIRKLRADDDRSSFTSGDEDLDRFFRKYAATNQIDLYIGTTYVLEEAGEIQGFATVAAATLHAEDFPASRARSLPRYPLPALRLARLAVDKAHRGRGVGTNLLRYVLVLALEMSQKVGCVGVVVDAKPPAVTFYSQFGFRPSHAVRGQVFARPELTPMILPMDDIRNAT
jgi:GNAT superfamily N-acetyltransferase